MRIGLGVVTVLCGVGFALAPARASASEEPILWGPRTDHTLVLFKPGILAFEPRDPGEYIGWDWGLEAGGYWSQGRGFGVSLTAAFDHWFSVDEKMHSFSLGPKTRFGYAADTVWVYGLGGLNAKIIKNDGDDEPDLGVGVSLGFGILGRLSDRLLLGTELGPDFGSYNARRGGDFLIQFKWSLVFGFMF